MSLFVFCQEARCASQEKALKFIQIHYFFGPTVVTIAKHAIRMDNIGRLKFSLVSKAPDWIITVFRDDDKTYFSESFKQLDDTGLVADFIIGRRDRYFPKTEKFRKSTISIFGFQADKYESSSTTFVCVPMSQVFNADQKIEDILQATYKLSTCGAIPLQNTGTRGPKNILETVSAEGSRETYLSTNKVIPVQVSSDIFDPPKGFKKAKSVREVVAGTNSRTKSRDVMDLFTPEEEQSK